MSLSYERLRRRPEFLAVARARRRWATPGLILQTVKRRAEDGGDGNDNEDGAGIVRFGYTASKKVGNAVARNRAKRRLRAAVAGLPAGTVRAGHDYVLIARTETLVRPFAALNDDLNMALKALHEGRGQNRQGGGNKTGNRGKHRGGAR